MAIVPSVYDELIEYLAKNASSDEILEFEISPKARERAEYLLERSSLGRLTPSERIELEQMTHFDGLVSVLKARALTNRGA